MKFISVVLKYLAQIQDLLKKVEPMVAKEAPKPAEQPKPKKKKYYKPKPIKNSSL